MKKLTKTLALLLAILLAIVLCSCDAQNGKDAPVGADTTVFETPEDESSDAVEGEEQNEESYEFAVAFLEDLYQNSYLYEENDLTQYVKSESLLKYLEGYQNIRRVIATDYRYYGLEYELLDCVTSGDYVYYEIMHTATIKYKNDEVTVSKATNAAFVIVENTPEGYVVKDWILPAHDDYYVGSMRGFDLNSLIKPELSDPCYWDEIAVDSKMLDTIDSLIETQQKRQNGADELKAVKIEDIPYETATIDSEISYVTEFIEAGFDVEFPPESNEYTYYLSIYNFGDEEISVPPTVDVHAYIGNGEWVKILFGEDDILELFIIGSGSNVTIRYFPHELPEGTYRGVMSYTTESGEEGYFSFDYVTKQ